jgi:hypothetical protein
MVHRALGHSNPSCTLHSPCSTQPRAGVCFLFSNWARSRVTFLPSSYVSVAVFFPKIGQIGVASLRAAFLSLFTLPLLVEAL